MVSTVAYTGAQVGEVSPAATRIGLGGVTGRIIRLVTPPVNGVPLVLRLGLEFLLLEFLLLEFSFGHGDHDP